MEQKLKQRKLMRVLFTNCTNELYRLILEKKPVNEIKVSWSLLQEPYEDLKLVEQQVYEFMIDDASMSEAEIIQELEGAKVYKKKYIELRQHVDAIEEHSSNRSSHQNRRRFKLPRIEFRKFDGTVKDWLPFWSQFTKVHDDPSLDDVDKFEYLRLATNSNSRVRMLVESYPATSQNYTKIVKALKARYGREDLQIEVQIRELLRIIINNASSSSSKPDIASLYDQLETPIRALDSLGITSEKWGAMLFPMIESCIPEELLRVWHRSSCAYGSDIAESDLEGMQGADETFSKRLSGLMKFLRSEVEHEQHISLAVERLGLQEAKEKKKHVSDKGTAEKIPTAVGLVNCDVSSCIFCEKSHESSNCFKAQQWSLEKKNKIVSNKKACFKCLRVGHAASKCKIPVKCMVCGKPHVVLMCSMLPIHQNKIEEKSKETLREIHTEANTQINSTRAHVFLQTLKVSLNGPAGSKSVRVLLDSGSHYTYILQSTAKNLGYTSKRSEKIIHSLFGGSKVLNEHHCYMVEARHRDYVCSFEALSQETICNSIPPVFDGPWTEELRTLNIERSDLGDPAPVELLIGIDLVGKLFTGRRKVLSSGLVASETFFGWTLMGKIPCEPENSTVLSAVSMLVNDSNLQQLWQLETLGITDPIEKKAQDVMVSEARELFLSTTKVDEENRYVVRLPWLSEHSPLPSNFGVAKKRLESTLQKLDRQNLRVDYNKVFQEWLDEGIIEQVHKQEKSDFVHYIPHRPVIKSASVTTKIRPVFDASAREKLSPSLNDCVQKGANLIELIPNILLGFRKQRFGVTNDIKKAFVQISIDDRDRDVLRFLWVDSEGREIIYRHRRVVFGLSCSPFLLGATIELHLQKAKGHNHLISSENLAKLATSFYVDNCVTSLSEENELKSFISESTAVMNLGKFELRGWEYTGQEGSQLTPILGLVWDKFADTLSVASDVIKDCELVHSRPVSKRTMLSIAQKIFDPVGFTCPATLLPKLLLRKTWEQKVSWDEKVTEEISSDFQRWLEEVHLLAQIKIPRWIHFSIRDSNELTMHVFCDASQNAYAAVVFLRGIFQGKVFIRLLAAKSRIAPLKKATIPRLELLAALIGARLSKSVLSGLAEEIKTHFWSDSTTVLSWIKRREQWSIFVANRVNEICSLSSPTEWSHVTGSKNPADLPSRGVLPSKLLESRWWEGPNWLYESPEKWPISSEQCDENEINGERIARCATCLNIHSDSIETWHLDHFSKFSKMLRMMGWILRFLHNCRARQKYDGELTSVELKKAENLIFKFVQLDAFTGDERKRLATLSSFVDEDGLIRVETKILKREDSNEFRRPILLPARHPVVSAVVYDAHVKACHIRTQGLLAILRERFWILGGRRSISVIIRKCSICRRHLSKPMVTEDPALPNNRVRDAAAFEIVGIDFAGPLVLKNEEMVWICVFTCAIYRAVHLELCTSLSTPNFFKALRRFISRRGRPKTIYTDNGTNFVGAANILNTVDWNAIVRETSCERLEWRFNPPAAPWWGGFCERMVGMIKQLLRRVLGRASLNYEDLMTILCDCEAVINSRPISFLSSSSQELMALCPVMYLRELPSTSVVDCDVVDRQSLTKKLQRLQVLRDSLRERFRSEYLGQLAILQSRRTSKSICVGEVVLVGDNDTKRLNWPMGIIKEVFPASDGQIRVVRVKTSRGILMRPIQRIYRLECSEETSEDVVREPTNHGSRSPEVNTSLPDNSDSRVRVSRVGRTIKRPKRYL
ncbi:uncharacterized protein LOC116176124 [Photinus pyralis]|uniref:uncharacterized protein LOC116176124 n=1 Tax=Photinus pyralis TaxID=7054 RepID=UPI00126750F9|nr:uncharacterized protein LOC116176124 [Photinus pyralis]